VARSGKGPRLSERNDYNLDTLLDRVVRFIKNHQHGPQPVLDVAGSFPPALVEYPKGYRKFREV
jgi:hypothetical protein